jgi:hypothetical protein
MNAIVRQPWLLGGKRGVQGASLDLGFMSPGTLDPRITFTRASTATYFDNTGTLQTAATNLILQSSDASNATWLKAGAVVVAPIVTGNQTTAPDGTLTASRAVYPAVVGTNALSVVYQNIALPTGVYTFTAYLKGNVGGERVWLSVAGWGSGPVATLTTQWQRFTFVTPTLPTATFGFQIGVDLRDGAQTSTSAQTIFIWGTQVEVGSLASFYTPTTTVANGAPRWDYNPSTHALNGLLIEEARTNLLLNSATLGTQSVTVTAVATTLSFYGTGTVTLSGTFAGSLVGTGAFPARASLTFTPTAGTLTCTVTGTVTNAQVEAGAFPTSYIPTTAASVTRAADNASMPTAAWFNASAGTLQAEVMIARATEAARFAGLVQIDSGSNTNRFNITTWTGLNSIRIFAAPSNPGVILGNWIANAITKGAATYAGLAVTGSLNGAAIQSGAMGSSPVGINNLKVGCSAAAGDELDGWIRRIRYWPRALSNAELQAVTS